MLSQTLIFIGILAIFLLWWWQRWRFYLWAEMLAEKGWKGTVHYHRCFNVFQSLYENINPTAISLNARRELNISDDVSYTYGEVRFYSFVKILEMAEPKPGEIFYDLGSGAGKAVIIAALVFDFAKVCGIEKLDALYQLSLSLQQKLTDLVAPYPFLHDKPASITFIHEDLLQQDFQEANIVYISATCFRNEMWHVITAKLLTLKKGSRVILGSAKLDNVGGFELMYNNIHLMSWGLNSVRIYRRI